MVFVTRIASFPIPEAIALAFVLLSLQLCLNSYGLNKTIEDECVQPDILLGYVGFTALQFPLGRCYVESCQGIVQVLPSQQLDLISRGIQKIAFEVERAF